MSARRLHFVSHLTAFTIALFIIVTWFSIILANIYRRRWEIRAKFIVKRESHFIESIGNPFLSREFDRYRACDVKREVNRGEAAGCVAPNESSRIIFLVHGEPCVRGSKLFGTIISEEFWLAKSRVKRKKRSIGRIFAKGIIILTRKEPRRNGENPEGDSKKGRRDWIVRTAVKFRNNKGD